MARIIPICKRLGLAFALLAASPAWAATDSNADVDRYFGARLAEIDNRQDIALKGYLGLFRKQADSEVLADRIFTSAIRSGDMVSALQAVRAQELRNAASPEAPLLLFADAYRRKNWAMANVAASELQARSNFAFMAPILKEWVNVAQGKAPKLAAPDAKVDPYFAYFSIDQRVYLALAAGQMDVAKSGFGALGNIDDDFARDLAIKAAPVFAANGDRVFAATILQSAVERDYGEALVKTAKNEPAAKLTPEDAIAALHLRVARTLLQQKNGEKALIFARIALWLAPKNDAAKLVLSQVLNDQGVTAPAIASLGEIAPASPYWPRAMNDKVRLLLTNNQQTEAVGIAQKARVLRPKSGNLALLVAQAFEATGDLKSAATAYSVLVKDADDARATSQQRALYRLFLATVQDKSGDWAMARKTLEQAQSIEPKNPFILNYLGYGLLERREDVPQALDYVKTAFKLAPESMAIADSLGWGYFLNGDYARALPLLESAVKTAGNDMTINEHLGDTYWLSGRFTDARYAWNVAAQTAMNDDALRLKGKIDLGLNSAHNKP